MSLQCGSRVKVCSGVNAFRQGCQNRGIRTVLKSNRTYGSIGPIGVKLPIHLVTIFINGGQRDSLIRP